MVESTKAEEETKEEQGLDAVSSVILPQADALFIHPTASGPVTLPTPDAEGVQGPATTAESCKTEVESDDSLQKRMLRAVWMSKRKRAM